MTYIPKPMDTSKVQLTNEILKLTELLSKHAHDVWATQRFKDGWQYGEQRDDQKKLHPCLIAYEELPESEKDYDRNAAMQTLKAIVALGYRIVKVDE
ncbi:Ryanodine receptor Ryr [Heliobacillus mobilis]|uniref:Ryanodine receptor Ryr n=1 Tax=Heliobacterium mobile TaxID=28064 RepID=A0A6I3SJC0_HELMO|nr:RyR domain-containing protein [Heliobacterium mobile]MTV48842.1 Ryanodine receptor Ryr [Heliobacterium mobile]